MQPKLTDNLRCYRVALRQGLVGRYGVSRILRRVIREQDGGGGLIRGRKRDIYPGADQQSEHAQRAPQPPPAPQRRADESQAGIRPGQIGCRAVPRRSARLGSPTGVPAEHPVSRRTTSGSGLGHSPSYLRGNACQARRAACAAGAAAAAARGRWCGRPSSGSATRMPTISRPSMAALTAARAS